MQNVTALSSPNHQWYKVAEDPRCSRSWNNYLQPMGAFVAVQSGVSVVIRSDEASVVSSSVHIADLPSRNILALSDLTAKISAGEAPQMTQEFLSAAEVALAANKSDRTPVSTWAKKLAASVFKR